MSGMLACPIQYELREQFERTHDHYNNTFCALLRTMDVEEASVHVRSLYDACMTAKKALQEHEGKHGC
jgi:hypothetical protein